MAHRISTLEEANVNATREADRLKEEAAETVTSLKTVQGTMKECQATVDQLKVRVVHEQAVSGNKSALSRKLEKIIGSQLATLSDNVKSMENFPQHQTFLKS